MGFLFFLPVAVVVLGKGPPAPLGTDPIPFFPWSNKKPSIWTCVGAGACKPLVSSSFLSWHLKLADTCLNLAIHKHDITSSNVFLSVAGVICTRGHFFPPGGFFSRSCLFFPYFFPCFSSFHNLLLKKYRPVSFLHPSNWIGVLLAFLLPEVHLFLFPSLLQMLRLYLVPFPISFQPPWGLAILQCCCLLPPSLGGILWRGFFIFFSIPCPPCVVVPVSSSPSKTSPFGECSVNVPPPPFLKASLLLVRSCSFPRTDPRLSAAVHPPIPPLQVLSLFHLGSFLLWCCFFLFFFFPFFSFPCWWWWLVVVGVTVCFKFFFFFSFPLSCFRSTIFYSFTSAFYFPSPCPGIYFFIWFYVLITLPLNRFSPFFIDKFIVTPLFLFFFGRSPPTIPLECLSHHVIYWGPPLQLIAVWIQASHVESPRISHC